ncbi:MAG: hypothetical protein KBT29_02410 [Prevotellaceae bacterium]|nr:hypothetical protein [Candidatus Minthosoma caballi]
MRRADAGQTTYPDKWNQQVAKSNLNTIQLGWYLSVIANSQTSDIVRN